MINAPPNHEIVRGRCFELTGESVMMGRSVDNEICLRDQSMGRKHARFELHEGAWWVVDMRSTNGVMVNHRKVDRAQLTSGDHIVLGAREMVFLSGDIEELHAELVAKLNVRDSETGLYDYGFFFERLERLSRRPAVELSTGGEALLAIDRHDELRDHFGEQLYARLIVALADLLSTHFGPSRLVARLDKNLFAVLFPEDDFRDAERSCVALREALIRDALLTRELERLSALAPDVTARTISVIEATGPALTLSVGLTNMVDDDRKDSGRSAHSRALQALMSSKDNRDLVRVVPIFMLPPMPHERY
jgi:GGDEF domain-containing protein